ncbi:MAG: hypothetical protein QM796_04695 [Chthoniobacteraceae bacterium]
MNATASRQNLSPICSRRNTGCAPKELNWVGCARPHGSGLRRGGRPIYKWVDNQTHLAGVLLEYLASMKKHWRTLEPKLFIEPLLHQWGYFFNPPGQVDWQTGQRGLDVYRCAEHVDGVLSLARR